MSKLLDFIAAFIFTLAVILGIGALLIFYGVAGVLVALAVVVFCAILGWAAERLFNI